MIVERNGQFHIGTSGKWFGSRAKAEAWLAKGKTPRAPKATQHVQQHLKTTLAATVPRHDEAAARASDEAQQAYNAKLKHLRATSWGKNLHKGAEVDTREDVGAYEDEFGGKIVGGPKTVKGDVRWHVSLHGDDDYEADRQWVSANCLRLSDLGV